jgi:hypothetical protein
MNLEQEKKLRSLPKDQQLKLLDVLLKSDVASSIEPQEPQQQAPTSQSPSPQVSEKEEPTPSASMNKTGLSSTQPVEPPLSLGLEGK